MMWLIHPAACKMVNDARRGRLPNWKENEMYKLKSIILY